LKNKVANLKIKLQMARPSEDIRGGNDVEDFNEGNQRQASLDPYEAVSNGLWNCKFVVLNS